MPVTQDPVNLLDLAQAHVLAVATLQAALGWQTRAEALVSALEPTDAWAYQRARLVADLAAEAVVAARDTCQRIRTIRTTERLRSST